MISIDRSSIPLTKSEQEQYKTALLDHDLDENIWDLYKQFLAVSSKYTTPCILRVKDNHKLLAHFYMIRSIDYGHTLSKSSIVKQLVRLLGVPSYTWMRSGIAAENFANPGFIVQGKEASLSYEHLIDYVRNKFFMLFIHDVDSNKQLHPKAVMLTYPDDGVVNLEHIATADDYLKEHSNLKKKFRAYRNKGGIIDIVKGRLSEGDQNMVEQCVYSTSKRSLFKLPYQDIYPAMCKSSSDIDNNNVIHFICRSDEHFFGYHSFLQFGNHMRCLNGAFNRELKSTFHAYENMIFKVIEYAMENNIEKVYFGPVLNETKRRMMNEFITTRLFAYSKYPFIIKAFAPIIKSSRMMNKQMLRFSNINAQSQI